MRSAKIAISLAVHGWDVAVGLLRRIVGSARPAKTVVLYYHVVRPESRAAFGRQLDALLRWGRPWRLDGEIDGSCGLHFAVTFDDGYISVLENAVPELRARGVPYTLFVPTGSWGGRPSWVKDSGHPFWHERVVTPVELGKAAQDALSTVGSHTVSHPRLSRLNDQSLDSELRNSKVELEKILGRAVDILSFPHGDYDERVAAHARSAGYRRLMTVEPSLVKVKGGSSLLGRVAVEPEDGGLEFYLKAHGAYRWNTWLKRWRQARETLSSKQ